MTCSGLEVRCRHSHDFSLTSLASDSELAVLFVSWERLSPLVIKVSRDLSQLADELHSLVAERVDPVNVLQGVDEGTQVAGDCPWTQASPILQRKEGLRL